MKPRAIIAGAGIGGLSAALALARKGQPSIVLERAGSLREIGAGIQLGPNAFRAFDSLGVGEAIRRMAVFIDALRLMDAIAGDEIVHLSVGQAFRDRFSNPYAVVHRGDLHKVLLEACRQQGSVDLRTHSEVVDYRQDGSSVTAVLAGGDTVVADLLVGADGLWSNVRRKVVGDGAPRVSGHSTYRSVIPVEQVPEEFRWNSVTLWAGPKCHIVHYPLSGWRLFNLVVTRDNDAPDVVAGKPVEREAVLSNFSHLHSRVLDLLRAGRDWKLWVLCDREPVHRWVDGRVALLGDAAHPTMQYLAQGGCMALEDSVCLAEMLTAFPDSIEAALAHYSSQRILRTARVQLQSRFAGDYIYHAAGVHAELRNAMMRAKSDEDYYNSLAWLYDGPSSDDFKIMGDGPVPQSGGGKMFG